VWVLHSKTFVSNVSIVGDVLYWKKKKKSYSEFSCGSLTVRVSSSEQSLPALHLQNTVHGNLVQQQLHLIVPHRLVPSEQVHLIRDIISSGARATPAGTVTGTKDFEGSCLR